MARPQSLGISVMALGALALAACATFGQPPDDLLRARSFCMGCTAYTGRVVSGERAFGMLLRRPDAAAQLQAVFDRGNVQAQMYALAGLREIDHDRFERAFERMRGRKFSVVRVATVAPVTSHDEPGEIVLRRIRSGDYKFFVDFYRSGEALRR